MIGWSGAAVAALLLFAFLGKIVGALILGAAGMKLKKRFTLEILE